MPSVPVTSAIAAMGRQTKKKLHGPACGRGSCSRAEARQIVRTAMVGDVETARVLGAVRQATEEKACEQPRSPGGIREWDQIQPQKSGCLPWA